MHVFNTYLTAVGIFKGINKLSELPILLSSEETSHLRKIYVKFFLKISIRKAIRFVVKQVVDTCLRQFELRSKIWEFSVISFIKLQRINVGKHMAVSHIGAY